MRATLMYLLTAILSFHAAAQNDLLPSNDSDNIGTAYYSEAYNCITSSSSFLLKSSVFDNPANQFHRPTCGAYAISMTMNYYEEKDKTRFYIPLSAYYIYNNVKDCKYCENGISLLKGLNFVTRRGNVQIAAYPNDTNNCVTETKTFLEVASEHKIAGYSNLPLSIEKYKQCLLKGDPIIIAIKVNMAFYKFSDPKGDIVFKDTSITTGLHGLIVIGFDDSKQALRILNSWGADWGNNGQAWISYDVTKALVTEAHTIKPFTRGLYALN